MIVGLDVYPEDEQQLNNHIELAATAEETAQAAS